MVSETQRPTPFNRRSATRNVDYDLLPWVETHGYQQPSLRDENDGPYPKNGARLGVALAAASVRSGEITLFLPQFTPQPILYQDVTPSIPYVWQKQD